MKKFLLLAIFAGVSFVLWKRASMEVPVEAAPAPIQPVARSLDLSISSERVAPPPPVVGLRVLDQWHRLGFSAWKPASGEESFASALTEFASIWEGQGGSYAAVLREAVPGVFGSDFDTFAKAWAEKGSAGLEASLENAEFRGPAWIAWQDALAHSALQNRDYEMGASALGKLLREMLNNGYSRDRILAYRDLVFDCRANCRSFLPFQSYTVQDGDSLNSIRNHFRKEGLKLSYGWMNLFNGRNVYKTAIRLGQELKLPTQAPSVEAWRGERLLIIYAGESPIGIYEASFGKDGDATPLGEFTLEDFLKEPVFWKQGDDPVPFGNPENPLGTRWMGFKEMPSYGIHGNTDAADTIGSFESLGCIRMFNDEVEELFEILPRGGQITILD
ncbi:MAG: L,D-transpeptidase [Planctomycetota bacterium]|nr:L,D-transpeptidase [Planctomycetota bacterium]